MNKPVFILVFTLFIVRVNAQCLIASYPLNGNATDITGNGNNGTVSGATSTDDRVGNANSAYSLDGASDYISIPHGNFLLNQFTYSLWVKTNSIPSNGAYTCPLSIGYSGGDQQILLSNDAGNGNVGWSGGGYDANVTPVDINVGSLPATGQWYHIVLTRTNSTYKFYVNGSLVGSLPHSGAAAGYGSSPTGSIGARRNSLQFFDGDIDDVRIFDCALSDSEVADLFNGVTGLENNSLTENQIKAYPNPSNDLVIVDNPLMTNYNIRVINNLGQVCFSANNISQTTIINRSELGATGLYFLQVRGTDNHLIAEKKIVFY